MEFEVLLPLRSLLLSITSSCNKVALCISSTQAAKFTSLFPLLYPHNFAAPKVNKDLIPKWFYLHRDRLSMYFKYKIDTHEDNVRKRQCEINNVNLESFMNESLQNIESKQKKSNKI